MEIKENRKTAKNLFWIALGVVFLADIILSVFCTIYFARSIDGDGYVTEAWWRTALHAVPVCGVVCLAGFIICLHPRIFSRLYENYALHRGAGDLEFILGGNEYAASKEKLYKCYKAVALGIAAIILIIAVMGCIFK